MPKTTKSNQISNISLEKLVAHPDSPNRMGKGNLAKLTCNIKRTGRYEPLVVRPCPGRRGFFQIINGHHRCRALRDLGYETAAAMIWDIDDHETDLLLAGINRLGGSDALDKKLAVLSRLNRRMQSAEMAKLLPLSRTQIERLTKIGAKNLPPIKPVRAELASPLVFFVNGRQKKIIESALSLERERSDGKTKAEKNAAILANLAQSLYLKSTQV